MKVHTFFTDTHRVFLERYFVPSFPFEPGIELVVGYGAQKCKTGEYNTVGWRETVAQKIGFIVKALHPENEVIIYADTDIQFFGKIKDEMARQLGDNDICLQDDRTSLCSGLFIMRTNRRVRAVFLNVRDALKSGRFRRDQPALNYFMKKSPDLRVGVLSHRFWTVGLTGAEWGGQDVLPPKDILVHHANWTRGVDNKIKLLDMIRKNYGK
jgi:hypothetical protein